MKKYFIALAFSSLKYISATLFYYPIKNIVAGIEYLNGGKHTHNNNFARAQRVNMMLKYLF